MSIILDALRKSDNERRRQERPSISQLPPVTAGTAMPGWVFTILGVLATLVVVLAVAFWHFAGSAGGRMPTAAHQAADQTNDSGARAGLEQRQEQAPAAAARPLAREIPPAPTTDTPRPGEQAAPTAAPPSSPAPAGTTVTPPAATSDLPSFDELMARGELSVPGLHMDLHVYATDPAQRFVFINGRRLRHGDEFAGGVRIVEILADGVILQHDGRRFVLPRD